MNKIIISFLTILLTSCQQKTNDEFIGFRAIKISMSEKHYLNIQDNKILSEKIIEDIIHAKKIKGPVKGIGIGIKLCRASDTIQILSFGGSEYFNYKGKYYKTKNNILPDSIINKFIRF